MPGNIIRYDPTCGGMSVASLAETPDEVRAKIQLKERDANVFYESCEIKKMNTEEYIVSLRKMIKRKRVELADCICGDVQVIRTAFHHRREELLAMQRFTPVRAIDEMNQKVSTIVNIWNALRYDRKKKKQQYDDLQDELDRMAAINSVEIDEEREQEIRRLQNEMDKTRIKFSAAKNITRKYEAVLDALQRDVRNYPAILDTLDAMTEKAEHDKKDMIVLNKKAIKTREDAWAELQKIEQSVYQAKRKRDQKLIVMRKEVDKRMEVIERTEKKPTKHTLIIEHSGSKPPADSSLQAKIQQEHTERQEKILTMENAFEMIMKTTHCSDIEDIVYRLENQDATFKQLQHMERQKMKKKEHITEKLSKLKTEFTELKYTSERQSRKGKKAVEAMAQYLKTEEARRNLAIDLYQQNNNLLMNLQSAIATILEKLKNVHLKPPLHNYARNDPIEDLQLCINRMHQLTSELGLKGDKLTPASRVETEELNRFIVSKLPQDNIRINIQTEEESDSNDFQLSHEQDNTGFKSRDDIKRQGKEIVSSKLKLKPKKEKKRRHRT